MTVTYTNEVADARLGGFSRLLIRWKGSVYKLFYKEFLIYIFFYFAVSMVYRFGLDHTGKLYFEKLCLQFEHYTDLIPISFVLGFYVTIVIGRWWSQFENLPFPDRIMLIIASNVHGADERGRLIRRTLLRYLNGAQVLTYRLISTAVYKRFPTLRHLVDAGLMTENEYRDLEEVETVNLKYWVPLLWFNNLLSKLRQEGRIYDDMTYKLIMEELNLFRSQCGTLVSYDWISIPLVYTQVVTVAVYMFFVSTLLSRQYLDPNSNHTGHGVDLYFPIFTVCQFFFYVGWLKVAEQLINPFGEDDDDFEVNWCIDRNLEVTMMVADQMYAKHPKLEKDKFWNVRKPELPYTAASVNHKVEPFMGSTFDMRINGGSKIIDDLYSSNYIGLRHGGEQEQKKESLLPNTLGNHEKSDRPNQLFTGSHSLHKSIYRLDQDAERHLLSSNVNSEKDATDTSGDDEASSFADLSDLPTCLHDGDASASESDNDEKVEISNKQTTAVSNAADDIHSTATAQNDTMQEFTKENQDLECLIQNDDKEGRDINSNLFSKSKKLTPKKRRFGLKPAISLRSYLSSDADISQNYGDKNEERRNAEKRVLSSRRRKTRNSLPPRKRHRTSYDRGNLWMKWSKRRYGQSVNIGSPDTGSMFSETDNGSAAFADSPFSSVLSCTASIPSPKPLRWAFHTTKKFYGDNISITSSQPSPSGTDSIFMDPLSTRSYTRRFRKRGNYINSSRFRKSSASIFSANHEVSSCSSSENHGAREDIIRPYTDDLRKRLQVVASSVATSVPKSSSRQTLTRKFASENNEKDYLQVPGKSAQIVNQLSTNNNKISNQASPTTQFSKLQTKFFKMKEAKSGRSIRQQHVSGDVKNGFDNLFANNATVQYQTKFTRKRGKLVKPEESFLSTDKNNNLSYVQTETTQKDPISLTFSPKQMRRTVNGSFWNALKTWNTKRKESKCKNKDVTFQNKIDDLKILSTIKSESDLEKQTNYETFPSDFPSVKAKEDYCNGSDGEKKSPELVKADCFSKMPISFKTISNSEERNCVDNTHDLSVLENRSNQETESVHWINEEAKPQQRFKKQSGWSPSLPMQDPFKLRLTSNSEAVISCNMQHEDSLSCNNHVLNNSIQDSVKMDSNNKIGESESVDTDRCENVLLVVPIESLPIDKDAIKLISTFNQEITYDENFIPTTHSETSFADVIVDGEVVSVIACDANNSQSCPDESNIKGQKEFWSSNAVPINTTPTLLKSKHVIFSETAGNESLEQSYYNSLNKSGINFFPGRDSVLSSAAGMIIHENDNSRKLDVIPEVCNDNKNNMEDIMAIC